MRIPLILGAYQSRSIIAEAQRCVNLFPEKNPEDSPVPVTHYPSPGLVLRGTAGSGGPWRANGLYFATNGQLFGVSGQTLYYIDTAWNLTALGTLSSNPPTPVSMVDNGDTLFIVDGNPIGWTVDLATHAFAQIVDATFLGADRVDIVDGFSVFNFPGTKDWGCTLDNEIVFNPLYRVGKNVYPDHVVGVCVVHREPWIIGQRTIEVWYDAGDVLFPFNIMPGAMIQWGAVNVGSIAAADLSIFMLGQNQQGAGIVLRGSGYEVKRVSTHAIEHIIQSYGYSSMQQSTAFTYQQDGHIFYQINFPQATWCYDVATDQWHQKVFNNGGTLERHRANCHAFAYGYHVVGDYVNGNLYTMETTAGTDNGTGIPRIRSFPHLLGKDGNRLKVTQFIADMEAGAGLDITAPAPQVTLQISRDRGKTYTTSLLQSFGATGEYLTQPQWNTLGMSRDFVFELSWTEDVPTALNGAWVDLVEAAS